MKALRLFLMLFAIASFSFMFSSCEEEGENQVEGVGDNYIKIPDGASSPVSVFVDAVPGTYTQHVDLIRDMNSASAANQPLDVTLEIDQSLLDAYNADNPDATYELLPTSLYQADPLTVHFDPGVANVSFDFSFDPSKLDKKYALPLKIVNAGNNVKVRTGLGSVLYTINAKNKYDGRYTVTGTMVDAANAALTGLYPMTWDLVSNGSKQVVVNDVEILGFPGHPILSSGNTSYYGSFGLIVDFDDNNNIVAVHNYYGTPPNYVAANGRSAELDPSGENKYDPATKTIKIKYWMNQPSVITPHRTSFDETWTFTGPR